MKDYTFKLIQLRRDTEENFFSNNTILAAGEPGYATDSNAFKIGDGVRPWSELDRLDKNKNLIGTWDCTNQNNFTSLSDMLPIEAGVMVRVTGTSTTINGVTYRSGDDLFFLKDVTRVDQLGADTDVLMKIDNTHVGEFDNYNSTGEIFNSYSGEDKNHAYGEYSHAEGVGNVAGGTAAHAEGSHSSAFGEAAHAEGSGNQAVADYSHAEGTGNTVTASAQGAHVSGTDNTANNPYAFVTGVGNESRYSYETVVGRYASNGGLRGRDVVFSVGAGSSDANRFTALVVDTNGNVRIAGGLYVNAEQIIPYPRITEAQIDTLFQ
jgi:hypothetical protein